MVFEATPSTEAGGSTTSAGAGVWDISTCAGAGAGSSFSAGVHIAEEGGTTGGGAKAP